jgi:glycerophosphoryl diester phosphodiesterase
MPPRALVLAALLSLAAGMAPAAGNQLLVIAHRGASGYLPEHTLAAKAVAHAQGADCIEQDVVLTADNQPIILHDIHLDTTTNAAEVFPDRARADGRWYAIDLSLDEVRTLDVTERRDPRTGNAVFPGRFPVGAGRFFVPTLAEEIELIEGLNKSTGRTVCLYVEIKAPEFHHAEGKNVSRIVLDLLRAHGYQDKDDPIYLQTFDAAELQRIRNDLGWQGKLVQLIGENHWNISPGTDFDTLKRPAGLAELAKVADGIGPSVGQVIDRSGQPTTLAQDAHAAGLQVHAYTARADALPRWAKDMDSVLDALVAAGVDGVFTDHPDIAMRYR